MISWLPRKIKRVHVESFAKYSRLVTITLAVLSVVYVSAVVFYQEFVELRGNQLALEAHAPLLPEIGAPISGSTISSSAARRYITEGQIFGKLELPEPAATPVVDSGPAKTAASTLNLIGTFISKSRDSYAIIENKQKSEQDVFLLRDTVFDQGVVSEIKSSHVVLDVAGKKELLYLEQGGENNSTPQIDSSAEVVVVAETDVQEALNNLPSLLTQARTVPYFSNGQRNGRRIFAIRTGSFFEKIGLVNGDIIKSINGTDLNDDSKALELFEEFKTSRTLTLRLVRNREEKVISYERR
jgi:type II secretion system protein C